MTEKRQVIYEQVKAATVAICLHYPDDRLIPFGSGFNVDPRGVVVTCKHVIEAAQVKRDAEGAAPTFPRSTHGVHSDLLQMHDIVAVFSLLDNGKVKLGIARFEVIHGSHNADLAVCRLRPDTPLPAAQLGNSDEVFEGQFVFTCGFPLGQDLQPKYPVGALFHRGIVAGVRPHYLVQPRREFLLDMSINPGNSGGPLCAEDNGQVVGVINARVPDKGLPTGIGCAVPANLAKPLVDTVSVLTDQQLEEMRKGK
ncbi:MAG: trypsin-like peptidase domain-containing protein [Nitrospinae bacterium]|nr:trypsin-like peptidase domain-containing protein [Nitrospinota bacterium]